MLNILNATFKKKKKKSKDQNLASSICDHSSYLEQCDVHDKRESIFLKKVGIARTFSKSSSYSLRINALEEDPDDGDQDG